MFALSVNTPVVKGEVKVNAVDPPMVDEIVLNVLLLLISSDDKFIDAPLIVTLPVPDAIVNEPPPVRTVPLRIAIPGAPLPPAPPLVEPPPPPDPGVLPFAPGALHA